MLATADRTVIDPAFDIVIVLSAIHGVLAIDWLLFGFILGVVFGDLILFLLEITVAEIAIGILRTVSGNRTCLRDGFVMVKYAVIMVDFIFGILNATASWYIPVRLMDGAIFLDVDSATPVDILDRDVAFFG